MGNTTYRRDHQTCLTCLVLAFLAGSGIWLKLILSDVLSMRQTHELLYEREFLPDADWSVARGLNITSDFSKCEFKPPSKRQLADEEWDDLYAPMPPRPPSNE